MRKGEIYHTESGIYWRKARQSKYKHLYRNNGAICGSEASPYPWGSSENVFLSPKCPKCLSLEGKMK